MELQGVNLRYRLTGVFLFLPPLQMELPGETEKEPNVSQLRLFTWPSTADIIPPIFKNSCILSKEMKVGDVHILTIVSSKLGKYVSNC